MHWKTLSTLLCLPMIITLVALAGCGGTTEEPRARPKTKTPAKGGTETAGKGLEAIEPKEYGTLSGTVTIDGDVPALEPQSFAGNPDAAVCAKGSEWEKVKQAWLVNTANKGVANVVIFLKAPEGKFFKLKAEDMNRSDVVEMHQPHCAFVPHVVALFPEYYDPAAKGMKSSGQVFKILNDAPINHNTGIVPNDESINSKASFTLKSGESKEFKGDTALKPDAGGPIGVKCDIHAWMNGKVWVFDHPYAAVTDKDGKFEIKNVPLGTKVSVVGWHEGAGYFYGGQGGKEMTIDGKTPLELKLKAK